MNCFKHRTIYTGFMEENVTAGQLFLQEIKFSPANYYTDVPYCFTSVRRHTIQIQLCYISCRKKSTYWLQSVFFCLYDLIRIIFCNNTQQMIFVTEKRCGFCAVKLTLTISFTLNANLWLETQSLSTKPDIFGNLLKFNISPITIHTKSATESYPQPAQSNSQVHTKHFFKLRCSLSSLQSYILHMYDIMRPQWLFRSFVSAYSRLNNPNVHTVSLGPLEHCSCASDCGSRHTIM